MKKPQLHISLEGGSFFRITEDLLNFGYQGLPDQVHFSISSNYDKTLINLHVTREIADRKNKPQIKIFEMPKLDIKPFLREIALVAFDYNYELQQSPYQQNLSRKDFYRKVAFLSFDELSNVPSIWNKTSIKKGKLRLTQSRLAKLESWAANSSVQRRITNQFTILPWRPYKKPQSGFLVSPAITGPVLILNGSYYRQREQIEPLEILKKILGDILARKLLVKMRNALRDIVKANNWQDSQQYSEPLLIGYFTARQIIDNC
jgi:hypothetical protein